MSLIFYLIQVPHLSITRHSLANRFSEQAIKHKVLLQQATINSNKSILNSIHIEDADVTHKPESSLYPLNENA